MPKLQMLLCSTFICFVYSLILNPSKIMAKWLVAPSPTYTTDYNIDTDYEEQSDIDATAYSVKILTSVLDRCVYWRCCSNILASWLRAITQEEWAGFIPCTP